MIIYKTFVNYRKKFIRSMAKGGDLMKKNDYRVENPDLMKKIKVTQKLSNDHPNVLSGETSDIKFNNDIKNLKDNLLDLKVLGLKYEQMQKNLLEIYENIINKYVDSNNDNTIYSIFNKNITPIKLLSYLNNKNPNEYNNDLLSIIKDYTSVDEKYKQKMLDYENVLSDFKATLDSFDTIELSKYGNNNIVEDYNLIGDSLQMVLENGSNYRHTNKNLIKNKDGSIYVVVFNKIKYKNRWTLIYNFRKYRDIFSESLLCYFLSVSKQNFLTDIGIGSGYLFFIQDELINSGNLKMEINLDIKVREHIKNKSKNIIDIFKILLGNTYKGVNLDKMAHILNSSNLNDINNIENLIKILTDEISYNYYIKMCNDLYNRFTVKSIYNTTSRFIFIVNDLEGLKQKIKSLGYDNINEGPQSFRGGGSYINKIVTGLDDDWRECLYRHHLYINNNRYSYNKPLTYSKFSYKNIHINLGYARWYSTLVK